MIKDLQLLPAAYRRFGLKTSVQLPKTDKTGNVVPHNFILKTLTTIVTLFNRQSDITRHNNEIKHSAPSLRRLNHPFIDQNTPEGMDFRFRARRINLTSYVSKTKTPPSNEQNKFKIKNKVDKK